MHRRLALVGVVLAAPALAAQGPLPLKHTPQRTVPAITPGDLMTRLYIYADDSMQGREAGKLGNFKATNYIAAQIRAMGLQPAGDSGTWFQTIPLKNRVFDTVSTVSVNGTPLALGEEYLPSGRESASASGAAVVYAGMLGDTLHELAPDQIKGKVLVFGIPADQGVLRRMRRAPVVAGAAAVVYPALDQIPPMFRPFFTRPQSFLDEGEAAPSAPPTFLVSQAVAEKMFGKPLDSLAAGAPGGTLSFDLRFSVTPSDYPARNVIGIIRGSDPKLRGEYVAIGAHNDHIGMTRPVDHDSVRIFNHIVRPEGADDGGKQATPEQMAEVNARLAEWRKTHPTRIDSISNGADDDGSGTVSALEIAQWFAAQKRKPRRSLLFVWHVGEEKGLLGSRWFTDHPTVPRDSIVAQLNMDMVGRGDSADEVGRTKDGVPIHGSPRYLQLVGSRRLSTELGDLIEQVNKDDHHNITFDYSIDADGHPANIYCRSDHYSYARYGIPITFFTTGLHEDYHQVTDEPEYIDYPHMAAVDSLVADIALHVANLDHRPVVDKPKPDPNAPCRQ